MPLSRTRLWTIRAGIGLFVALSWSTVALAESKGVAFAKCMGTAGSDYNDATKGCSNLPANGTTVATSRDFCMTMAAITFQTDSDNCTKQLSGSASIVAGGQTVQPRGPRHAAMVAPDVLAGHSLSNGGSGQKPGFAVGLVSAGQAHVRLR